MIDFILNQVNAETVARSILIVKYKIPLSSGNIYTKLSKKKFKLKYKDKNGYDKTIELTHEISNLKRSSFGVQGDIQYHFQKENEFRGKGVYDVTIQEFSFLFDPLSGIVILQGDPTFQVRLLKFFTDILHNGDDLFESITIRKEKLHDLMNKILDMRKGKNNLEEARFYHYDTPLQKLKKLSFTTIPDYCGTEHLLFNKHYANCTHWSCVLRVHKCNGLLDQQLEKSYLLRLNKDASVSFGIDKDLTEWNRFVVETMKPTLKF